MDAEGVEGQVDEGVPSKWSVRLATIVESSVLSFFVRGACQQFSTHGVRREPWLPRRLQSSARAVKVSTQI
eukprot:2994475-Amphidinium_carterae.1